MRRPPLNVKMNASGGGRRAQFRSIEIRSAAPTWSVKPGDPVDAVAPARRPELVAMPGQATGRVLPGVLDLWRLKKTSSFSSSRVAPLGAPPTSKKIQWTLDLKDPILSAPTVGLDGTIYVRTQRGDLNAVDSDGSLKWRIPVGHASTHEVSPAVGDEGTLYIGGADEKDHRLYAIDPSGAVKWSFVTAGKIASRPAIALDGTVIVGDQAYRAYALTPDGQLRWTFKADGALYGSPAVDDQGTAYFVSYACSVYAIALDGTLRWSTKLSQSNNPLKRSSVNLSLALGPHGTVYVRAEDGLYAVGPEGTLQWKFPFQGDIDSAPSVCGEGTVYLGSPDNCLAAISEEGDLRWKFKAGGGVHSSSVVGSDGTIYFGAQDDFVYAIHSDGKPKWKVSLNDDVVASPALGGDGSLYVGSRDGRLYAFAPEKSSP